jgi:hypothetical protein
VREAHRRTDPRLEPVPGDPGHDVACLLAPAKRRAIWSQLEAGREPDQARAAVDLEEEPA